MAETPAPATRSKRRLRKFVHRKEGASRLGFKSDRSALKDAAVILITAILIVIAAFWIASRFMRPAPPDEFVMSTGAPGGAYHLFAERYRDILARNGVRIELKGSAGSMENFKRLTDSGADVALIQGGITAPDKTQGLVSLGSVYYEPLWIFYRAKTEATLLNDLHGKRIAIGAEGSGTRALASQLLTAVGANQGAATLLPLGGNAAVDALLEGKVDACFIVAAPDAPVVQRLIRAADLRIMNIANAEAVT